MHGCVCGAACLHVACRGELPGDYGYDPLGLGRDPAKLDRAVELELLHARWAMLGALGALVPGQRYVRYMLGLVRWWARGRGAAVNSRGALCQAAARPGIRQGSAARAGAPHSS